MLRDVADPWPTCRVTSAPVRGENVSLSCIMTYYNYGYNASRYVSEYTSLANMSASIRWESAAGTVLSSTFSKTVITNQHGIDIGGTLQTDVLVLASGTEIPSYNCTAEFEFTTRQGRNAIFANNSLSWSCVSAPVSTWCKYTALNLPRLKYYQ